MESYLIPEKTYLETRTEPLKGQEAIGGSHFAEALDHTLREALSAVVLPPVLYVCNTTHTHTHNLNSHPEHHGQRIVSPPYIQDPAE